MNNAAVGGLPSSLSSITTNLSPLFPETPSSHSGDVTATNLSLDSSFSIWDPLSPKSLIKHELQRSAVCLIVEIVEMIQRLIEVFYCINNEYEGKVLVIKYWLKCVSTIVRY